MAKRAAPKNPPITAGRLNHTGDPWLAVDWASRPDAAASGCSWAGGGSGGAVALEAAPGISVAVKSMVGSGRLRRRTPTGGPGVVGFSDIRFSFVNRPN